MELKRYAEVLWRRKVAVLLTPLITVAIVGLATLLMPPVYSSSAVVRVAHVGDMSYAELTYVDRLIGTYVHLVKTRPYLQQAIERLNLATDTQSLNNAVRVQALPETELIQITANSTDPNMASAVADTLASLLTEGAQPVEGQAARNHQILLVEPAATPVEPTSPRPLLYLVLAMVVGLVGGLGLAFALENLDTTIRSREHLERVSRLPLVGSIPSLAASGRFGGAPILLNGAVRSRAGEAFRVLATNTLFTAFDGNGRDWPGGKALMMSGLESESGKSTVLANLAVAVAKAGHRVVVVDADLESPVLHRLFSVENKIGFREVLLGSARVSDALTPTKLAGLKVLPIGSSPGGSDLLLNPARVKHALQALMTDADLVLVNSSPVLSGADAAVLAPAVDGVLLVAAKGKATEEKVDEALKQLHRVGGKTVGMVLTRDD
jgi:polysaccharide biosynthesis transport protein